MTFATQLASAFTPIAAVYDSPSVTRALSHAESLVQSFCNQTFDLVTNDTVFVSPARYRTALLPQVPVVAVHAVQALLPPQANTTASLTLTTGTGGSFTAGTYYWVVTAIINGVEMNPSNEVNLAVTGTASAVLSWSAVPLATSYNVYRGIASGAENLLVGSTSSLTFTDTGVAGAGQAPPRGMVWTTLTNYRYVLETGLIYDTTGEPGSGIPVAGNTFGTFGTVSWPWLPNSLQVTYDHGYAIIPQPLIDVACRLAQQYLENPASIMQRRTGDSETRYAGSKGVLISEIDQMILGRYMDIGIG